MISDMWQTIMLIYTLLPASVSGNNVMKKTKANHFYYFFYLFNIFIIIIIIIIILGISFMQSIYTHIPETNHIPREHCVATILM
jgi:hypothetical protein